LTLFIRIS